jgi:sporulation protein YlmC with PRC-barrel domain
MADFDLHDVHRYVGVELFDRDGERIGKIEDVYLNEATGRPEWLRVSVGIVGIRSTLVPVERLGDDRGKLVIRHDKAFVQAAPVYPEPYGALPPADEARLFSYYGLPAEQFGGPHAALPSQAH